MASDSWRGVSEIADGNAAENRPAGSSDAIGTRSSRFYVIGTGFA